MSAKTTAKGRHKLLIPSKVTLSVHKIAKPAFKVWCQFRPPQNHIHIDSVDDYHKPAVRLVELQGNYYYFNAFKRMDAIIRFEANTRQPFSIIEGQESAIRTMAWVEVLELAFFRDIHHALFWQQLKIHCPPNLLKTLMNTTSLTRDDYCRFVGIDTHQFEYQQRVTAKEVDVLCLPQDMSWAEE